MRRSSIIEQISINSYAAQQEKEERDVRYYRIKIIVLGATGTGKSTMLYQYTHQRKPEFQNPTFGTDFLSKIQYVDNIECHLQIWDTADYTSPSIPQSLYNGALGFIIVYDITRQKTFDLIYSIMNDLAEKGDRNKQIFIVGNKKDKQAYGERQVKKEQVANLTKNRKIVPREICSFKYQEVEELFQDLNQRIVDKIKRNVIDRRDVEKQALKSGRVIISGEGFQKRYNRCC